MSEFGEMGEMSEMYEMLKSVKWVKSGFRYVKISTPRINKGFPSPLKNQKTTVI